MSKTFLYRIFGFGKIPRRRPAIEHGEREIRRQVGGVRIPGGRSNKFRLPSEWQAGKFARDSVPRLTLQ
jgi:hypothetical protein